MLHGSTGTAYTFSRVIDIGGTAIVTLVADEEERSLPPSRLTSAGQGDLKSTLDGNALNVDFNAVAW